MALSRVHTSAKAADVAKLLVLVLNKRLNTYPAMQSMVVPPSNGKA